MQRDKCLHRQKNATIWRVKSTDMVGFPVGPMFFPFNGLAANRTGSTRCSRNTFMRKIVLAAAAAGAALALGLR